jgi:hypothetical protein
MNLIDKYLNKCYSGEDDTAYSEDAFVLELILFLDVGKVRQCYRRCEESFNFRAGFRP